MHEFPQERPSSENREAPDSFPSLEQMVADIGEYWDFCCAGEDEPDGITQMFNPFEELYGYPDPQIIWGRETYREHQAEKAGTLPPKPSLPRIAADIWGYDHLAQKLARESKPVPTFEESCGYPDPREAAPGSSPYAAPEDDQL